MDDVIERQGHSPENVPGVASKELVKKHSLELMRALQEKNNPGQPFITVLGEGEDQMVILNKPINISKEGKNPSLARLMITSTGVIALNAPYTNDYVNGIHGIRNARKEGAVMKATLEKSENDGKPYLLISLDYELTDLTVQNNLSKTKDGEWIDDKRFMHLVPVLEMDFQNADKIQEAIRESYQEAKEIDQPKIKLFADLNDFTKTLGENPSIPPQPPTTPGPTT